MTDKTAANLIVVMVIAFLLFAAGCIFIKAYDLCPDKITLEVRF